MFQFWIFDAFITAAWSFLIHMDNSCALMCMIALIYGCHYYYYYYWLMYFPVVSQEYQHGASPWWIQIQNLWWCDLFFCLIDMSFFNSIFINPSKWKNIHFTFHFFARDCMSSCFLVVAWPNLFICFNEHMKLSYNISLFMMVADC